LVSSHPISIGSLHDAYEKLVPQRVVRFRPEYGDIVNAKVAKLRKKRDRFLKSYKKSGSQIDLLNARITTKKMIKSIKKEKLRVVQKKLETPNPKAFWSVINGMLGKRDFNRI
jgi:hypothetical protein